MNKLDLLNEIQNIFIDVLDNENIKLEFETNADDIEEWDSLSNIQIIVSIEKQYGIRFNSEEMLSWKNVGEMINCIISK